MRKPRRVNRDLLQSVGRKRVAIRKVAAVQSALEPALPLFACAVGECMGLHALSGIALQGIIANLRSRIHRLGDVAAFQTAELFLCCARPDP